MRRFATGLFSIAWAALGGCGFTPKAELTGSSTGAANSSGHLTGTGNSTGATEVQRRNGAARANRTSRIKASAGIKATAAIIRGGDVHQEYRDGG